MGGGLQLAAVPVDLVAEVPALGLQDGDALAHVRVVLGEQVQALGNGGLAAAGEFGVAAHPGDRHAGVPQAAQHLEPLQVVLAEPAVPARGALDVVQQADSLVVAQGVQAEARSPRGLAGGEGTGHAAQHRIWSALQVKDQTFARQGRPCGQAGNSRAISAISSSASGARLSAAAFCSACATVRMPGIGTVRGLRASSQHSAPWARVRPPPDSTARIASSRASHSGAGRPSRKYSTQTWLARTSSSGSRDAAVYFPVSRPMASGLLTTLARSFASQVASIRGPSANTFIGCWTAAQCGLAANAAARSGSCVLHP